MALRGRDENMSEMVEMASMVKAMVKGGINPTDIAKMYLAPKVAPPNVRISRVSTEETFRLALAYGINKNKFWYTSLNCGVLESFLDWLLDLRISLGDKGRDDLMSAYRSEQDDDATLTRFTNWLQRRGGNS